MNQIDFSISIAHLYPDLLNIYGDLGNIVTIKNRCGWRGIEVKIENIKSGYRFNPDDYEFYFIGGGQDTQQVLASVELLKNKERLHKAAEQNAVILGICGGYQLLGHYYQPLNGERIEGVGLLNAYTIAGKKRFIGNVTGKCASIDNATITGFENHSGLTYLKGETEPLIKLSKGFGNNGKDRKEGASRRSPIR